MNYSRRVKTIVQDAFFLLKAAAVAALCGFLLNTFRPNPVVRFSTANNQDFLGASTSSAEESALSEKINLEDLIRLSRSGKITIIDARPELLYRRGHIPGALNLPSTLISTGSKPELPMSKDERIVVYCVDIKCDASSKVARFLKQAGYTNISIFSGGWVQWVEARLPEEVTR